MFTAPGVQGQGEARSSEGPLYFQNREHGAVRERLFVLGEREVTQGEGAADKEGIGSDDEVADEEHLYDAFQGVSGSWEGRFEAKIFLRYHGDCVR